MSQAVAEVIPVARFGDHGPGQAVALLAGHAGFNSVDGCKLGAKHYVVDLPEGIVGFPDHHGAGNVGAIPAYHGAHVDNNRLAAANGPFRRLVVGHGSIGTGGYDGVEAETVGPIVSHCHFHAPSHFPLSHALPDLGTNLFHSGVGGVDGLLQHSQLVAVLYGALGFRHP